MPSPLDAAIGLIGQARRASEGQAPASVPAGLPEPEPPGLRAEGLRKAEEAEERARLLVEQQARLLDEARREAHQLLAARRAAERVPRSAA